MDIEWAKLIAEHIFSWPVAAVTLGLLFRKPLVELFNDLKRVKIGSAEIERFDKAIKKSEDVVSELETLQILLAEAALSEMRAIDDSPYAPEQHKKLIKRKADDLAKHLETLRERQGVKHAAH